MREPLAQAIERKYDVNIPVKMGKNAPLAQVIKRDSHRKKRRLYRHIQIIKHASALVNSNTVYTTFAFYLHRVEVAPAAACAVEHVPQARWVHWEAHLRWTGLM